MATAVEALDARISDRHRALFRVSETLIAGRDPKELLAVLARELREVVEFDYLGLSVYDEKRHQFSLRTFDERGTPILPPKIAPEDTVTWWVYQQQHPLVIPFVDRDTRFPVASELLGDGL